jgi:hypothetical protein
MRCVLIRQHLIDGVDVGEYRFPSFIESVFTLGQKLPS